VIFNAINPKTNERSQVEIEISPAIANAARLDFAVAEFVSDLAREKLPPGFMLLGTDFRTP
jgi:hypothetical protein